MTDREPDDKDFVQIFPAPNVTVVLPEMIGYKVNGRASAVEHQPGKFVQGDDITTWSIKNPPTE